MQHPDDRPVRGGRPSLLSPDEQAAPERQGILSSLDGMPAQARAAQGPRPRSRALAWGVAALGAIVVGGAWFLLGGGGEQRAPAVAVAVAAVADVPRAAPVTPVAMPAPAAPAPAVLRDEPAAPEVPIANPLAEMAAPAAPEHPKPRAAKAEKKETRAHRKAHEAAQEKRTKPRAEREPDSDVVLLAALMSHMEPVNRKATPAQQLEACRRYNAAGEEQCRARVCERVGRKEAACKRVPAPRADTES